MSNQNRTASGKLAHLYRQKVAADIRRILIPLLEPLRPFVRNYNQFIMKAADDLTKWTAIVPPQIKWDCEMVSEGEKVIETKPWSQYGPDATEEYVRYPDTIQCKGLFTVQVRDLARSLAQEWAAPGQGRAMYPALIELLNNDAAAKMIFKVMSDALFNEWGSLDTWNDVTGDHIRDFVSDNTKGGRLVGIGFSSARLAGRVKYRLSGQSVQFLLTGTVDVDDNTDAELAEPDVDPDLDADWGWGGARY